jgi:flagellar biosynthetic protein FliQ
MTTELIIRIMREGLLLVLLISAGPMLSGMIVGLVVSILQATTQIQEQTLTFVPKIVVVFLTVAILGPWMLVQLIRFTRVLFESIAMIH